MGRRGEAYDGEPFKIKMFVIMTLGVIFHSVYIISFHKDNKLYLKIHSFLMDSPFGDKNSYFLFERK